MRMNFYRAAEWYLWDLEQSRNINKRRLNITQHGPISLFHCESRCVSACDDRFDTDRSESCALIRPASSLWRWLEKWVESSLPSWYLLFKANILRCNVLALGLAISCMGVISVWRSRTRFEARDVKNCCFSFYKSTINSNSLLPSLDNKIIIHKQTNMTQL